MAEQTLKELEEATCLAYQVFDEQTILRNAAQLAAEEAEQTRQEALYNLGDEYGVYVQDHQNRMDQYKDALDAKSKAEQALEQANEAYYNAAVAAQAAIDALEAKKTQLRNAAKTDTGFVVHSARVECSHGTQNTLLALKNTHGVDTKGFPQMLVTDQIFDENIFSFWGCKSEANPAVREAAEQAVMAAQAQINENRDWRDKVVDFLCGKTEINVADNVMEQITGECIAKFPKDAIWEKGQENMEINGKQPMLRRCVFECDYGGRISILLCGQEE